MVEETPPRVRAMAVRTLNMLFTSGDLRTGNISI